MGKPKVTESQWKTFLVSLANGSTITDSCKAAKISRDTWWRYNNGPDAIHKEFARTVKKILRIRTVVVVDALYKNAIDGNFQAQKFWLCNRAADEWSDKYLLNTIVEGKVDINITDEQKEAELTANIERQLRITKLAEGET